MNMKKFEESFEEYLKYNFIKHFASREHGGLTLIVRRLFCYNCKTGRRLVADKYLPVWSSVDVAWWIFSCKNLLISWTSSWKSTCALIMLLGLISKQDISSSCIHYWTTQRPIWCDDSLIKGGSGSGWVGFEFWALWVTHYTQLEPLINKSDWVGRLALLQLVVLSLIWLGRLVSKYRHNSNPSWLLMGSEFRNSSLNHTGIKVQTEPWVTGLGSS